MTSFVNGPQPCEVLANMLNEAGIDAPFFTSLARRKDRSNANYLHVRIYNRLSDDDRQIFDDEINGAFLQDPQLRTQYHQRVREHQAAVLQESSAVICTIAMLSKLRSAFRHLIFTAVIVDEASQCTETELLLPLTQSAQKVILVGDEKQLGPTVTALTSLIDLSPATRNVMRELKFSGFYTLVERYRHKRVIQNLKVQYRMMPSIFELIALRIYEDEDQQHPHQFFQANNDMHYLRIGMTDLNGRFGNDPSARQVFFIDTWPLYAAEEQTEDSPSYSNPIEADEVVKLYTSKKDQYDQYGWTLGITAPYRDQVLLLKKRFIDTFGRTIFDNKMVTIGTVDSFQGSERHIIYISTTRANLTGDVGFLRDRSRLNVMLTRAKLRLHIFGCNNTLATCQSDILREYLNYGTPTSTTATDVYTSTYNRIAKSQEEQIP